MKKRKTTTISLADSDLATVEALKETLDLTTTTEVIRSAIRIAKIAAENIGKNRVFKFERRDGQKAMMVL